MFGSVAFAQQEKKIIGSWTVIGMSDEEMAYDIKKDSVSFRKPLEMDSVAAKSIASQLLSQMKEMIFVFGKNGIYSDKYQGVTKGTGRYSIDTKDSIITVKGTRNGVSFIERIKYQFKGDLLILITHEDGDSLQFTCKRLQ